MKADNLVMEYYKALVTFVRNWTEPQNIVHSIFQGKIGGFLSACCDICMEY